MAIRNLLTPVRVLAASGLRAPRVVASCLACVMAVMAGVQSDAQSQGPPFFVAGRNVNTLGPILDPPLTGPNPLSGNPYSKQRNEPSCDVSPYNQMVVLCAYNDYRGIPIFKDSWIGLSMTNNGGRTWFDRLLDGFPTAPAGIGAADPIVRAVPGLAVIAYITLDANRSRGTLSIAHMLEKNRENGEPYQFLQKFVIDIGNSGRFLDKPDMEVVLDPLGGTIQVGSHAIPKARVYFSYAVFTGTGPNGNGASIFNMFSDDYGQSWSNPKKLSASLGANQGVDIGVDDATGTVITTWRQIADNNQADAIIFSRSTNKGQTWSAAAPIWTAPTTGRFFDQETSIFAFRTLSMPAIVHDGTAFHTYFSARGFPGSHPDDARIVVSNSANGLSWGPPLVVSANAGRGHQIIPQVAVGGGSIQVDWIDTRNNDPQSFGPSIADYRYTFDGTTYQRVPIDAPLGAAGTEFIYRNSADIYGVQGAVGESQAYSNAQAISRYRFGLDTDNTQRQLEFNFINGRMYRTGTTPFNGDYHVIASQRYLQTDSGTWIRNAGPVKINPNTGQPDPNLGPMTSNAMFYAAFPDNRDVRGFVWLGLSSTPYTPGGTTTQEAEGGLENATTCASTGNNALSTTELTSLTDAPRSRFQNVYAAPIYPGLVVMSPSGSKPTSTTLERAFVVFVQNLMTRPTDPVDRTYQFTIGTPPTGVRASFLPSDAPETFPFRRSCDNTECTQMTVKVGRGSSATRTVYVKLNSATANPRPKIRVTVTGNTPDTQTGSVLLNGMPSDIEIETPDVPGLPKLLDIEGYQPDLLSRSLIINDALIVNPDLTPPRPTTEYPRDGYPRDGNPRDGYPRDGYPRDGYPRDGNPRDGYHSVAYPRDANPRDGYPRDGYSRLGNSALTFSAVTADDVNTGTLKVADLTWPVITAPPDTNGANYGNTVTGMSAQIFTNGTIPPACSESVTTNCLKGAQLIVWVPHFYTAIVSCSGERATVFDNQIILNTVIKPEDLPAFLARSSDGPNTVNPELSQPTFWVGPKQVVFSTLRLFGTLTDTQFQTLAARTGIIVRSQPDTSDVNGTEDSEDIDTTGPTLDFGGIDVSGPVEGNARGGANVTLNITANDPSGVSLGCSIGSTPISPTGSTFFGLGSSLVSCTATDGNNNTATGGFTVNVVDKTPPTVTVPSIAVTASPTGTGGANVSFSTSATDIVDANPVVTCTPASGSLFQIGTTQVSCTARDASGNVSVAATFPVTVGKISTTTTVTAPNATYDGLPHGATAQATSPFGPSQPVTPVTYTGTTNAGTAYNSTVAPTDAGSYTASATFTETDIYLGSSDSKVFSIGKGTSTTTVSCPASVPFTGSPVTPCSVSITGAGGLSLSPAPAYANNVSAGTATASYTYAGDANHTGSNDSKGFSIGKATSATTVTCPASVPYTGVPVTPCSVSVTGAGGLSLAPTPTYTNNIGAGIATASYTYGGDANHTGSSDSKTFSITFPYGFVAVSFPSSGNQGSALPMVWRYTLNGAPFNSSSLLPDFRVISLTSCTNGIETGVPFDNQYAPGNSNFQFTATTPFTWQYNWQTKTFVKGCYNVYIVTKSSAGVTVQINGPFKVQLK